MTSVTPVLRVESKRVKYEKAIMGICLFFGGKMLKLLKQIADYTELFSIGLRLYCTKQRKAPRGAKGKLFILV